MLSEIAFVAKIHSENGFSFYLPTKLVKWLGLEYRTWNNEALITSSTGDKVKVDCSATRHKETWKFSFYRWEGKGLKVKTDYLIRIPIPISR